MHERSYLNFRGHFETADCGRTGGKRISMLIFRRIPLFAFTILSSGRNLLVSACQKMSSFAPGDFSISYVTVPSEEVAETIANTLLENRLAACVNIIPGLTSIYRWKGRIEKDKELLLMIKSPTIKLDELKSTVKAKHPYETCEVISVPIQGGNEPYLQFLHDATIGQKH